jgi:hypothetical protein
MIMLQGCPIPDFADPICAEFSPCEIGSFFRVPGFSDGTRASISARPRFFRRQSTHNEGEIGMKTLQQMLPAMALVLLASQASSAQGRWAYLWADQPFSASYTPNTTYQANSAGATNTMQRSGTGSYTASLPNLGASAGTVHVTAYGIGTETCKVASWFPSGSTQLVNIRCFDRSGLPIDTLFTMTFTNPASTAGPMAFLWADQPSAVSYTPSTQYQFNSSGATNTITRTTTGTYTANLPNLGAAAGHVQVTAYGTGSERCKVTGWGPSGSTQLVGVQCHDSSGTPVDTRFTLTYVANMNLIGGASLFGAHFGGPGPGPSGSYLWANQPSSASYTPNLLYQWDDLASSPANTVSRSGTGQYKVQFVNHSMAFGDVQVTAYGFGSEYCKVAFWNPFDGVQVRCFNAGGSPVDTLFDVVFLDWFQGF